MGVHGDPTGRQNQIPRRSTVTTRNRQTGSPAGVQPPRQNDLDGGTLSGRPQSRRCQPPAILGWLPLEGDVVLKAREMWPRAARVFCAQDGSAWTDSAGLVDDAAILLCRRRGAAIDLVLDRPRLARSQFIFTTARGRPAVWWQTQKTVQVANPGARVPRGRAPGRLLIAVDTREKYGWRLAGRSVELERHALPAGDYAAMAEGAILGVVERKTMENLATSLLDGSLVFQSQRLGEARHAAVVVEAGYPDLFRTQPGRGSLGWRTCSGVWLRIIRRCRSSSPVRGALPRSGPTDTSVPLPEMARPATWVPRAHRPDWR